MYLIVIKAVHFQNPGFETQMYPGIRLLFEELLQRGANPSILLDKKYSYYNTFENNCNSATGKKLHGNACERHNQLKEMIKSFGPWGTFTKARG